jgi:hypothetical protein
MNLATGSLELAHARIWARWGARPDEALWRRIEITRDLGAVLDIARSSSLARWIEGIAAGAGLHAIERALRRHWRERVAELATWMPAAWQPAVAWCALLVDLPVVQHLARGEGAPGWVTDDEALGALHDADGAAAGDGRRALLEAARGEPARLMPLWLAEWRAKLPREAGRGTLEQVLVPLVAAHATAFAAPQTVDGWALRRALQARLVLLLRRTLVEPASAFVYLALSALEFERLRAELIRRTAFARRSSAP